MNTPISTEATPTPQARAGDDDERVLVSRKVLREAARIIEPGMTKAECCEMSNALIELADGLTPPQAPARDAGAVAWTNQPSLDRMGRIGYVEMWKAPRHDRTVPLYTHPAAASDDAIRAFVQDLADEGLRRDLNPTHDMRNQRTSEEFWHRYMRDADETIRSRARAALSSPDGLRKGEG